MKAGTSTLHSFLGQHPEIAMSLVKETDFFLEHNFVKGLNWYVSQFPASNKLRGEASPNYTMLPGSKGVAQRIYSVIPDAKLIYIIRDPIERMLSHVHHLTVRGLETRSIKEILNDPYSSYINYGKYHMQISEFLTYFSKQKVHICLQERLSEKPQEFMKEIFDFLGVNQKFETPYFRVRLYESKNKKIRGSLGKFLDKFPAYESGKKFARMVTPESLYNKASKFLFGRSVAKQLPDSEDIALLKKIFAEDIASLRKMTGFSLSEWRTCYETDLRT